MLSSRTFAVSTTTLDTFAVPEIFGVCRNMICHCLIRNAVSFTAADGHRVQRLNCKFYLFLCAKILHYILYKRKAI